MNYGDAKTMRDCVYLPYGYFIKALRERTIHIVFSPFVHKILTGKPKAMWYVLWGIAFYTPLIISPIFSYMYNNWWLMFGWIAGYIGAILAKGNYQWVFNIPFLGWMYYLYKNGFLLSDTISYLFLCLSISYIFAKLSSHLANSAMIHAMVHSEEFYELMVEDAKVLIVKGKNFIPENYGL